MEVTSAGRRSSAAGVAPVAEGATERRRMKSGEARGSVGVAVASQAAALSQSSRPQEESRETAKGQKKGAKSRQRGDSGSSRGSSFEEVGSHWQAFVAQQKRQQVQRGLPGVTLRTMSRRAAARSWRVRALVVRSALKVRSSRRKGLRGGGLTIPRGFEVSGSETCAGLLARMISGSTSPVRP